MIFVVGDGMGVSTVTAARVFSVGIAHDSQTIVVYEESDLRNAFGIADKRVIPEPSAIVNATGRASFAEGNYDRECKGRGGVVMISRAHLTICVGLALPLVPPTAGTLADLRPQTAAAFDRYVAETEHQREESLATGSPFLWIQGQRTGGQRVSLEQLRGGTFVIERLTTTASDGKKFEVPDGLIHHWLGAVFVPGVSLDQAIALLQDYDRHATIYAPAVARSKVLSRDGDSFRVLLRFFMKKVITVVVDGEHQARFTRLAPDRAHSRVVSIRLNEVEDPGTDRERLKPEGRDGGYLWRINSYWRFLERDGGTYVQCETITLSRRIPVGLGWLVGPFVTSVPKDSLEFTLTTTRQALAATVNSGGGRPR